MGIAETLLPRQIAAATKLTELYAGEILADATNRAPLEEGTLRGSGNVSDPDDTDGIISVTISFNTPYAKRQELEESYHHPHGEAHYLENAFKSKVDGYQPLLARAIAATA
jgi:hypothetical protein